MASSWLDSWGNSWGDAWGQQATDPNALRGTAAGMATAAASLTAIVWLSGSSAGSSTAQAYLELDGGPPLIAIPTGAPVFPRRRPRIPLALPAGPVEDDEALLLLELV